MIFKLHDDGLNDEEIFEIDTLEVGLEHLFERLKDKKFNSYLGLMAWGTELALAQLPKKERANYLIFIAKNIEKMGDKIFNNADEYQEWYKDDR
jgi:hypothetical protein